jgi:hypothetical protein
MALVSIAKSKGVNADYGPHVGKAGWQDWNIVQFALANDYVIVTNNRRHFLKEYLKQDLHGGLVIIVPSVDRDDQVRLFTTALDAAIALESSLINKVIEILEDGSVHIREWTMVDHDVNHISDPAWR